MSRNDESGFTLVELLVTVVLLGIIAGGTASAMVTVQRSNQYQAQLREAAVEARVVFERIRKELRAARRIEVANPDAMRFWLDGNFDGIVQTDEQITYQVVQVGSSPDRFEVLRYDGTTGVSGADVLARTLRNATPFSYDAVVPGDVTVTTFDFVYDVLTSRGPTAQQFETTVRLRNVG